MSDNENSNKVLNALLVKKPSLRESEGQNSTAWLVSFTDVIALMLTFFVLLYAMSDPVVQRWESKLGVSPDSRGEYGRARQSGVNEGANINYEDFRKAEDIGYLESVLRELLSRSEVLSAVEIVRRERSIVLYVGDLNDINSFLIKRLPSILDNLDNQISVASSWGDNDLQTFRALQNFVNALFLHGYTRPIPISVFGHVPANDKRIMVIIDAHDGHRITR